MKKIFIFSIFIFSTTKVFSYPITPQTLRKLIIESTYIVVAQIDNPIKPQIYFDKETNDTIIKNVISFGGDGIADLHVQQVIKGELNENHIIVKYNGEVSNPRPPYFPDKEIVLAFLTKEDTSIYYNVPALSYGTKVFENKAILNSYISKIRDYIEILKIKSKKKQRRATVEWLVQCSIDTNTRWEGAYELSRKRHWVSYYDHSRDLQFSKNLTRLQKQKLDSVFFSSDTIYYSQLCLSDFVNKKNYPKLRLLILKNLEFAYFSIAQDLMKKYVDITPNKELKKLYEEAEVLSDLDENDLEKYKK